MNVADVTTDTYGNRYIAELDDWAWMLARLEVWLGDAGPETVDDWADFVGPGGIGLDQVVYVLSHWAPRMRALAGTTTTPRRRR
jgi:hypothetical protein